MAVVDRTETLLGGLSCVIHNAFKQTVSFPNKIPLIMTVWNITGILPSFCDTDSKFLNLFNIWSFLKKSQEVLSWKSCVRKNSFGFDNTYVQRPREMFGFLCAGSFSTVYLLTGWSMKEVWVTQWPIPFGGFHWGMRVGHSKFYLSLCPRRLEYVWCNVHISRKCILISFSKPFFLAAANRSFVRSFGSAAY